MHFDLGSTLTRPDDHDEGMTLRDVEVCAPDLLQYLNPEHLTGIASNVLDARMELIDTLLDGSRQLSATLRGILIGARVAILGHVASHMDDMI